MKTKLVCAAAILLISLCCSSSRADTFFPFINIGDAFTGSMSIDTSTPLACAGGCPANLYALPKVNFVWSSPIGAITINIAGDVFASPITVIGSDPGRWFEGGGGVGGPKPTLNGTLFAAGFMDLFLYGSTTSTGSILPESFSAYSCPSSCLNTTGAPAELYMQGNDPDSKFFFEVYGVLSTLDLVDSSSGLATFNFTGSVFSSVLADTTLAGPSPKATPIPATLPLFVTGLGVVGLIGCRGHNKTARRGAA